MRRQKEVAVRLALRSGWRHIPRMLHIGNGMICIIALAAGVGRLFAAVDQQLGRRVAIKLIRDDVDEPPSRERFLREARAAAVLSHPNACQLFEVGEHDGFPFLVMELLEGEPLSTRLEARRTERGDAVTAPAVTAPGAITGTMRYMAPEQLTGDPIDARTDIFAVGVILFELLTGHVTVQLVDGSGGSVQHNPLQSRRRNAASSRHTARSVSD